ncbi:macrosialin-like [Stegostoma tigrinum]|uniref:macrosialin-like n=1 Tax=Stegostoma tigrinum TaxID=3053191 RepID=UPI00286FC31B|nr:macrosialin-like [Stegostoma tigrinum]
MYPSSVLCCILLATISAANGNTECDGSHCPPRPKPATLLPPTVISPRKPATLVPPTVIGPVTTTIPPTPANHTTHAPANHTTHAPANHTTHAPANHTTHAPANHTTHAPANHTTHAPANHTTHAPANHTTHAPANHTTHAPANHTTHAPANHTTHAPANHTTHAPANHTTHAPANHTTHAPANHTTHAPANHTTHAPANHTTHTVWPTSVHPSPAPSSNSGSYNVTNNQTVCALAKLEIRLRVRYPTAESKSAWGEFIINPNRTTASGTCGTDSVTMNLTFPEGFLTFGFKKNSKQQTFSLSAVHSELMYSFPDAAGPGRYLVWNNSLTVLQTHLGHSFLCSSLLVKGSSSFWVHLINQQVQVFEIPSTPRFGPVERCPQDRRVSDVVIVIVVLLVVLILVMLVAYLIGRKRHPAGYQSI